MAGETFGERLQGARMRWGLSVSDLARAVDVTEAAIRKLESGEVKYPSFPLGYRLTDVLSVSAPYLLYGRSGGAKENESRSLAVVVKAQERQGMQIAALHRRVSTLEARAGGVPRRTTPG